MTPSPDAGPSPVPPRRALPRIVGGVLGLALLGLAAWIVVRDASTLRDAWASIQNASPWLLLAVLALPVLSWSLTAMMYCSLTNRDRDIVRRRHVRLTEMHAVLGSAWLLNFLPARPGMVGRIAYHTQVNRIPLPSVIKASLWAVVCGVAASATLVAVALMLMLLRDVSAAGLQPAVQLAGIALPAVTLACGAWLLRTREGHRRVLLALLARYLDVLTWLARYACIFAMLGRPLSLLEAAALAAASQASNMVPLVGNGMGVREWASALLAPALPAVDGAATLTRSLTLSAELVHRASEVLVAVPIGLASMAVVSRRAMGRRR